MNSKWTVGLKLVTRTIKVLDKNIRINLCDNESDNNISDMAQKKTCDKEK